MTSRAHASTHPRYRTPGTHDSNKLVFDLPVAFSHTRTPVWSLPEFLIRERGMRNVSVKQRSRCHPDSRPVASRPRCRIVSTGPFSSSTSGMSTKLHVFPPARPRPAAPLPVNRVSYASGWLPVLAPTVLFVEFSPKRRSRENRGPWRRRGKRREYRGLRRRRQDRSATI